MGENGMRADLVSRIAAERRIQEPKKQNSEARIQNPKDGKRAAGGRRQALGLADVVRCSILASGF